MRKRDVPHIFIFICAIYGTDFSGAKEAGNKIWIAKGIADAGRLCGVGVLQGEGFPEIRKGNQGTVRLEFEQTKGRSNWAEITIFCGDN